MRQLVLPRRTTSPGEESTAKCSSSVAIWTFSGCSMTAKMEVSGIAPPLEMAIMRAPRRAWEVAQHAVAECVGAIATAAAFDAVVQKSEEFLVMFVGKLAVRPGAAQDVVERGLLPAFRADHGDDLLHQDVGRRVWDFEAVEFARDHLAEKRGLLEEIVACGGEEAAFRDGTAPMACTANALHRYGHGAGGRDLANEIDGADIDAELKGSGGDEDLDLAGLEALFGVQAKGAGE